MKRWIYLLIVSAFFMGGCTKQDHPYIDQGMQAIEQGNYEEALTDFDTGIEEKEDLQLAYRGKGIAYLGLENYEAAIEQLKLSLKQTNGSVHELELDTSYYLALSQYKEGDIESAITTYTNILAYDDEKAEAYYLRGVVYLAQGNTDLAYADFDASIAAYSKNYKYYIEIYKNLNSEGFTDKGEEYLNRLLDLGGKDAEAYYYRGVAYRYLGNSEEAVDELTKAEEAGDTEAFYELGKVYQQMGNGEDAITAYQTYLEQNPETDDAGEVYNAIGLCQIQTEDCEGAITSFEAGIALDQADSLQELLFNEIVAYETLLDFETAKELVESYLEQYPKDSTALREYEFLKTR